MIATLTWLQWAILLFFVGQPVALFFAYAVGIQYQRESLPGWLRSGCQLAAAVGLLIDVLANWSVLSLLLWEWPRATEYTFSTRLERLVTQTGWRFRLALPIARVLNWIAPPGHPHILNAVEI